MKSDFRSRFGAAMDFAPERVKINARQSTTEDLLDRVTVYRKGMEPVAVEIIEDELRDRGLEQEQIEAHAESRGKVIYDSNGIAVCCSFCDRPAIHQAWDWHRMLAHGLNGIITLVPLYRLGFISYCAVHLPKPVSDSEPLPSEDDSHHPE
jgi:hypothetical protein